MDDTHDAKRVPALAPPRVIELAIDGRWEELLLRLDTAVPADELCEPTKGNRQVLHLAAEAGNAAVVRRLLELGAGGLPPAPASRSPLGLAVLSGSKETVDALLEAGAAGDLDRLEAVIEGGSGPATALSMAAHLGHAAIVRRLLAEGAQVYAAGEPAPKAAVRGGSQECLDALLAASADPEARASALASGPMLALAASSGCVAMVRRLLALGSREAAASSVLLSKACARGGPEMVEAILAARTEVGAPELCDRDKAAALTSAAASEQSAETVALCLRLGFAEAVEWRLRPQPLQMACKHGNDEACCMILDHGGVMAELRADDRTLRGVLGEACARGCSGAVQRLVEAGAEVRRGDAETAAASGSVATLETILCALGGASAIFGTDGGDAHAAHEGGGPAPVRLSAGAVLIDAVQCDLCGEAMVRRLVELGAGPSAPDAGGTTPLMAACGARRADLAAVLLSAGAADTVDACDGRGATAADLAARSMDADSLRSTLRAMREAGAAASLRRPELVLAAARSRHLDAIHAVLDEAEPEDVDARDSQGMTPLAHSAMAGRPSAVRRLLSLGADLGAVSGRGETVLICAARGQCAATVRIVLEAGGGWRSGSGHDIDAATLEGMTALAEAAADGSAAIVSLLAGAAARADTTDSGGLSTLAHASGSLNPSIVRSVLEAEGGLRFVCGAPTAGSDSDDDTDDGNESASARLPMSRAIRCDPPGTSDADRAAVLQLLVDHGADPSEAFVRAARRGGPLSETVWQAALDAGPLVPSRNFRWVSRRRLVLWRQLVVG